MGNVRELDPISFRILWSRLVGVAEEAGAILRHSAFSSIVSEGNDCTAVLFDAQGRELAEPVSFTATSFIGTVPRTMKIFLDQVPPDQWRPGDVLICNDPWICTGHLFDICIALPIFHRDRLVAFSATCSHTPNIGGSGGRVDVETVFEEGLRIPISWLYREGTENGTVRDFIRANIPFPDQVLGDISAQVNANRTMARRATEIMDELELEDWSAFQRQLDQICNDAMSEAIHSIPAGEYPYSLRTDGTSDEITIETVAVVPGDGTITVDFTGTTSQVGHAINCPIHYTLARTFYALKAVLLPSIPNNESTFRSVTVVAPPGCILNPTPPAANSARSVTGHFVPSAVMGALGVAIPDRVLAEGAGSCWSINAQGERPNGKPFSVHLPTGCGQGASLDRAGMDAVTYPGNPANTPVEILERESSILVEGKALRRESGGVGLQRGGWGQRLAFRVSGRTPVTFSVYGDRTKVPAQGLAGGGKGGLGSASINGESIDIKRPFTGQPNDLIVVETPGGGGYGSLADDQ